MEKLKEKFDFWFDRLVERGMIFGIIVGLLPAALIFYAAFALFIQPGFAANESRDKQVAALETDVVRGRAVEASQTEFKNEFKKTVGLFYESLPLLPKESEISNVLTGVQSVAGRYHVVLTGLNAVRQGQKTGNADKLYEREIPASVVGNYDDVMRFFLDLSRQTRILIVRDYSVEAALASKGKGARPSFVAADFVLLAYHAPPPAEFPNLPPDLVPDALTLPGSAETAPVKFQAGTGR